MKIKINQLILFQKAQKMFKFELDTSMTWDMFFFFLQFEALGQSDKNGYDSK